MFTWIKYNCFICSLVTFYEVENNTKNRLKIPCCRCDSCFVYMYVW